MKIHYLLTVICSLVIWKIHAQDAQITQFSHSPIYLNPAFTGTTNEFRFSVLQRLQWQNMASKNQTTIFSAEWNMDLLRSGFGLLITHDQAGIYRMNTTGIGATYSYMVPIQSGVLKFGIQGNYFRKSLDFSHLTFVSEVLDDQESVSEISWGRSHGFFDFSSGILFHNERFWAGIGLHHISRPNQSILSVQSNLGRKFSVHIGAHLETYVGNGNMYIVPTFLYKRQGSVHQFDISTRFGFENIPILLGFSYRGIPFQKTYSTLNQDAVTFMAGILFKKFTCVYSYDFTISGLATHSGGSHEIGLVWEFASEAYHRRKHVRCPAFFGRRSSR